MPIDPDPEPSNFTPLPPSYTPTFGQRVKDAAAKVATATKVAGSKIADAWRRLQTVAEDEAPVIADHVWSDVLAHIRSHGLDAFAFDHARAASIIVAKILADRSHVAVALTADLSRADAEAAIKLAVRHALRYLAAIGYAGGHEPVASDGGPKGAA
jgi:hypothetical protein